MKKQTSKAKHVLQMLEGSSPPKTLVKKLQSKGIKLDDYDADAYALSKRPIPGFKAVKNPPLELKDKAYPHVYRLWAGDMSRGPWGDAVIDFGVVDDLMDAV